VRAGLLVLVAVLALAGCSSETAGEPTKVGLPSVGPVDLVVPIEMCPVVGQSTSTSATPSATPSAPPSQTQLPDPSGELLTLSPPVMTIERLDGAAMVFDNTAWALSIDLTDKDTATFASWTADHIGERLAMVIDGEVVVAPMIQDAITGGSLQISGDYTRDDIQKLLDKITGR
jgi:preprotein translocase subunit SecD